MSINPSLNLGKSSNISFNELEYNLGIMSEALDNNVEVDSGFIEIFKTAIVNLQDNKDVSATRLVELSQVLESNDKTIKVIQNKHLEAAVIDRDADRVEELLDNGANIDYKGRDGNAPLHHACFNRDYNTARLLLERGAKLHPENNVGDLPINIASGAYGHEDKSMVRLLNSVRLQRAVIAGDSQLVAKLVKVENISLNYLNKDGNAAMHLAVINGNYEIAKLLAENGADLTIKNSEGRTLVQLQDDDDILDIILMKLSKTLLRRVLTDEVTKQEIQDLIDAGADINAQDEFGFTPLHIAASEGNLNVVKILVELGADQGIENEFEEPPIETAFRNGHKNIVDFLFNCE